MNKLSLNSTSTQLVKELSGGHSFTLTERVDGEFKGINKPRLLTALMAPTINSHMTRSFIYDVEAKTAQNFAGKSYSERGPALPIDGASQNTFSIPSFGLTYQVLPQDYDGKRIPNSREMMTEDYVLGKQQEKALDAMDILNEIGMGNLLVNDNNYINGGPYTQYDLSNYINGTSRAAELDLDLGTASAMATRLAVAKERKILTEKLGLAGKDANGFVVICGDSFFNSRLELEAQLGLARDLMNTLDLASMAVPTVSDGVFGFDNFASIDGCTYVNYGATILAGGKVIDDEDGYMIPVGVSNMITIELAPAMVRGIVNTEAEAMYMFSEEGLRTGVTSEIETNRLFLNRNPELIRKLTTTS